VSGRWWVVWGATAVLASAAAWLLLDPILGAFVAILALTFLALTFLARDWDEHSTYEERELARARRRQEKWERGAAARERDRARWEAHQARKAAKDQPPGQ
jgi:membrane protein implicated in regulation of membrane protease activity